LRDLAVDARIIAKWVLRKFNDRCRYNSYGFELYAMNSFIDNNNEIRGP
jgi:hypothetical protein